MRVSALIEVLPGELDADVAVVTADQHARLVAPNDVARDVALVIILVDEIDDRVRVEPERPEAPAVRIEASEEVDGVVVDVLPDVVVAPHLTPHVRDELLRQRLAHVREELLDVDALGRFRLVAGEGEPDDALEGASLLARLLVAHRNFRILDVDELVAPGGEVPNELLADDGVREFGELDAGVPAVLAGGPEVHLGHALLPVLVDETIGFGRNAVGDQAELLGHRIRVLNVREIDRNLDILQASHVRLLSIGKAVVLSPIFGGIPRSATTCKDTIN